MSKLLSTEFRHDYLHAPLVELSRGRAASQGGVFFFPGAGDGITTFVTLSSMIDLGIPIYGLQPRGLDHLQEPYASIDEMVNIYIEPLCSKVASGPFYLLGHSFGGYIALELARRLVARGKEVKPLIMLDVGPPESPHVHPTRIESLVALVEVMELASAESFGLSAEMLQSLSEEDQLLLLHQRMVATSVLPRQSDVDAIRGMVNVFIANGHMEYLPEEAYQGKALLINALNSKESKSERSRDYRLWQSHVPHLEYRESPGNHVTVLSRENVGVLADIIEEKWI